MAEEPENKITVLSQNDPNLPKFLDFKKLRKKGLDHIGSFSGKIWTDHNVHDPGITILEVLIYALMDLGYKTNLPFKDLITPQNLSKKDDNFLTPLEILTINPVTITDYRKLLLEIEGVRNAWLEPVNQETPLFIDQRTNTVVCSRPATVEPPTEEIYLPEAGLVSIEGNDDCIIEEPYVPLDLNGLYKVYIEKDIDIIQNDAQEKRLIGNVKKLLAAHRNLCEDFKQICVLTPVDIGVCAQVEIEAGFTPEKIYAQIIKAIKDFVQPQIRYYTLHELLDKGKSIDEIFAGRPYRQESFGFVDTEEFEGLERRKAMYLSDLYSIILGIDGVQKVKKVNFKGGNVLPPSDYCKKKDNTSSVWAKGIGISNNEVPVFSLKTSCIDIYSGQGFIPLDKFKIHQSFSFAKKFQLPDSDLNCQVPSGRFREDLGAHESIQNDFPVVYGIGDDGLPDSASLLRKTQALQLKGYLMFYDQLLANYTIQLANLRSLYSLTPEPQRSPSEKHTYFTQLPESIPGVKHLLRFYGENEQLPKGSRLAIPVARDTKWDKAKAKLLSSPGARLTIAGYCDEKSSLLSIHTFPSAAIRAIYVNQLVDTFFNDNYTIEVLTDRGGYLFILYPVLPNDVVLVGIKRYATFNEAMNQAKNSAFLCALQANYNLVSDLTHPSGSDHHYFNLSYNPLSYIDLIQGLTEDKQEYLSRRKQFLDHLLARFGEEFTDYTLLQYQNRAGEIGVNEETINDQSVYINQFAEISRNRARAFNYQENSWNTDNVSGFEKRISLLAGIDDYNRRNLCNFEVLPCYRLQLKGVKGNILFRSTRSYDNKEELHLAAKKVLLSLRLPGTYDRLEKNLNGFNRETVQRIFSKTSSDENITVAQYQYHHQLLDFHNKPVVDDAQKLRFKKTALSKEPEFIVKLNSGEAEAYAHQKYRLLPTGQSHRYINTYNLDYEIKTLISYKWHKLDNTTKNIVKCEPIFSDEKEAWNQLIREPESKKYLTTHTNALRWKLPIRNTIEMHGFHYHPDRSKAIGAWRQAKMLGSAADNYILKRKKETLVLQLNNAKGQCIAISNPIPKEQLDQETLVEDCVQVFSNRSTRPRYGRAEAKFGFRIPKKDGSPLLVSYSSYDSEKEALEHMGKAHILGHQKKNYLLSGDAGNPEYNYILRDENDTFLALPPEHLETVTDRDNTLKATQLFLRKNKIPALVREEPRRYTWSLLDNEKVILSSNKEHPTSAKAQVDFDKSIVAKAKEGSLKVLVPHYYTFNVKAIPLRYEFLYGTSDTKNELNPIFKSRDTYISHEAAAKAYGIFTKKLPTLSLRASTKKGDGFDFALYEKGEKIPLAVQYKMGNTKSTLTAAKELTEYLNKIYDDKGDPKEQFIVNAIAEHQEKHYEWRFYKKNAPLAISPYNCPEKGMAQYIKHKICDVAPSIPLKECPPKEKVVCPKKNPGKYHYQVCFKDISGGEFVLNSYIGYDSYKEAEAAWALHWIEVIDIARAMENYGPKGKISPEEIYADPYSNACNDASYIAVIPEDFSRKLQDNGIKVKTYYLELANLFPIFRFPENQNDPCSTKYVYRVTHSKEGFIDSKCKLTTKLPFQGNLLWESVECYVTVEEAIDAYRHFYTLACIPNNCRILCKQGQYHVGLVEVMVESACEFVSEAEAWDDAFPKKIDLCNTCIPGGVREFIYAAEDCHNYIPVCDHKYWTFKVVSPYYFVVDHNCYYDNEKERDIQMQRWLKVLKEIDWTEYITKETFKKASTNPQFHFLSHFINVNEKHNQISNDFCDWVQAVRECLPKCIKDEKTTEEQFQDVLGLPTKYV